MAPRVETTGTSLLTQVRRRAVIHAKRKVRSVLDGEYGSVHKGRSMDFDDLREYVAGDDVKDIDWKATARHGAPLIKRYVATRQHAIMLVVDTGRSMAALSDADSTKRDVAVMVAGIIGQLALRHGDLVGLVAGPGHPDDPARRTTGSAIRHVPIGRGDAHLERILRVIHDSIDADGDPSDLEAVLQFVSSRMRRRMILVIVAGDGELGPEHHAQLRRLHAQHEILVCNVGDVAVADGGLDEDVLTIESGARLPAFLRRHLGLADELATLSAARTKHSIDSLNRLGIVSTRVHGEAAAPRHVYELLERQRARR